MNIISLLQEARTQLPSLEAELLLAHVLNKSRSYLLAWPETELTQEQITLFHNYCARRLQKEPIAYILGVKEFWSLPLVVTPDTLIPRPETELLVEAVLRLFPDKSQIIKVADLGTGTGAIAIALASERSNWQIFATDVSENALQIASKNAQELGFGHISFCRSNWCTALPVFDFDVIVSNPPYIAETEWQTYSDDLLFEPRTALISGDDGLDAIRVISTQAKHYLRPGGYLLIEHGFQQGQAVHAILVHEGYQHIELIIDLAGQERITMARRV